MDFLKFVNSNDIREYLKKISYAPSSLECAWLVYQSTGATLEEKIEAWEYIFNHMPDQELPNTSDDTFHGTLHTFLKKHAPIKRECLNEFISKDHQNASYFYDIELFSDEKSSELFSTFEECKSALYNAYPNEELLEIRIYKTESDHKNAYQYFAELSQKGEIIDAFGVTKNNREFISTFRSMKIRFPLPFKSGDILYDLQHQHPFSNLNPFVFHKICESTPTDAKAHIICLDYTTSMLYEDQLDNYMNFEYYREEPHGTNNLLELVSKYYKEPPQDILNYLNRYLITFIDGELRRFTAEHQLVKKELGMRGKHDGKLQINL